MKLFFDCETTGKNPYSCELITGYILTEDSREHLIESQVDEWSEAAEKIHKISFDDMKLMPYKATAWDYVLEFLQGELDIELVVYANPQTELGYLLFDVVVFKMHLLNHFNLNRVEHLPFNITGYSVHSLAKECARLNLFTPIKNEKTNRVSFTQENVYRALFNDGYNAHNAKDDVLAMKRIYTELLNRKNKGLVSRGQLSLF